MIQVTRFDGSKVYVNALQIEFIESTPDTVIKMLSGRALVVKEPVDVVIKLIINFYKEIGLRTPVLPEG